MFSNFLLWVFLQRILKLKVILYTVHNFQYIIIQSSLLKIKRISVLSDLEILVLKKLIVVIYLHSPTLWQLYFKLQNDI